jgi:hypothetical protein
MTEQYEIRLPGDLKLMVSFLGHPIDFDIVFPDSRRVNFTETPGKGISITPPSGLHPVPTPEAGVPLTKPANRNTISQSPGGPTISYVVYADGTVPMVPRTP